MGHETRPWDASGDLTFIVNRIAVSIYLLAAIRFFYVKNRGEKQMAEAKASASGGIGFVGLLTILFIALKLTGHITWSWFWVLSPLWIAALVIIGIIALFIWAIK